MRIRLIVRMTSAGTLVRLVDIYTGEILDEWTDPATEGADLPFVVNDAVAYYRHMYAPERVYFDVERVPDDE